MDTTLLRPIWARIFRRAWFLNLVLFLILAGIRCWGLFGPTETRMLVMLNFLLMWCFPFVFYSRSGRRAVGLIRIHDFRWLYRGMFIAALASLIIFFIGYELYGLGADNWYISLRDSFDIDAVLKQLPRLKLFLLYTIPAMLFSPVGEEFFFRGMTLPRLRSGWVDERQQWLMRLLSAAYIFCIMVSARRLQACSSPGSRERCGL